MMTSLLLCCVLGEDVSSTLLDYYEKGQLVKKDLSFMLRTCFQECVNRFECPHVILFPFLASVYLTPYERDLKRNCESIRTFVREIVNRRRSENESLASQKEDLLSILISDPLFCDNTESIIDELLTIFFAVSQTSAQTT